MAINKTDMFLVLNNAADLSGADIKTWTVHFHSHLSLFPVPVSTFGSYLRQQMAFPLVGNYR